MTDLVENSRAKPSRNHGINYEPTGKVRSEIYRDVLPLINSGAVGLLENGRFITQLCSLQHRTGGRGKGFIDHPPAGHDDLINAAAGALDKAWETNGKPKQERPFGWTPPKAEFADPLEMYR